MNHLLWEHANAVLNATVSENASSAADTSQLELYKSISKIFRESMSDYLPSTAFTEGSEPIKQELAVPKEIAMGLMSILHEIKKGAKRLGSGNAQEMLGNKTVHPTT